MKQTLGVFVTYLVVIAAGLTVYTVIGFARQGDDPAAGAVVSAFADALEAGDGDRACSLFTEDARGEVEQARRKSCATGVLELRRFIAPIGEPRVVDRAENSAIVRMSGGGTYFLDETPGGWRLSSAGCDPNVGLPYECEVEG